MHIKKAFLGLTLSLLLGNGMAAADWGDVYYCTMTNQATITLDGEITNYKLVTFQFKLDQTRNAMIFGNKGFLKDSVAELVEDWAWPSQEAWYAKNFISTIYFDKGKLLYALVGTGDMTVISADCDKF